MSSCGYETSDSYSPVGEDWEKAFADAVEVWNNASSLVNFTIVPYSSGNYDIAVYRVLSNCPKAAALANSPTSNNRPGPRIHINYNFDDIVDPNRQLNELGKTKVKLSTAIHELGHTIGLGHTDKEKKNNQGQVIDSHISGTPQLGGDPASIMIWQADAANPATVLSAGDIKAVRTLYPEEPDGSAWEQLPGFGTDISIGADGSVFLLGKKNVPGGHEVYEWNGSGWTKLEGATGVKITIDPSGNPWLVDSNNYIRRYK